MPTPRVITHQVGEWSWNADKLFSRIIAQDNTSCLAWTGSKNHQVNLYGGYRNGRSQMNNVSRFLWMTEYGEDIANYAVKMSCGNRHCASVNHMYLDANLHKVTKKVRRKQK
jgi:hypothetical protein